MEGYGRLFSALLMLAGLASSCATTPPVDEKDGLVRTHYTLEVGEKTPHLAPLPDETKISVNWFMKNGSSTKVDGFRGWDFNGDGRFEMVESLNEDGSLKSRAFDFDGDGVIDETQASSN